jgi:hypothetical protein
MHAVERERIGVSCHAVTIPEYVHGCAAKAPRLAGDFQEWKSDRIAALRCEACAFKTIEHGARFPVSGAGTGWQRRRASVRHCGIGGHVWRRLFFGAAACACREDRREQRIRRMSCVQNPR